MVSWSKTVGGRRTQYIKAQYHASTRNGNFLSSLLKKYSWNCFVFGLTTSFLIPNIDITRVRHFSSSSICESRLAVDDGLERPESMELAGDDDLE
jgi:hypothetical protein